MQYPAHTRLVRPQKYKKQNISPTAAAMAGIQKATAREPVSSSHRPCTSRATRAASQNRRPESRRGYWLR